MASVISIHLVECVHAPILLLGIFWAQYSCLSRSLLVSRQMGSNLLDNTPGHQLDDLTYSRPFPEKPYNCLTDKPELLGKIETSSAEIVWCSPEVHTLWETWSSAESWGSVLWGLEGKPGPVRCWWRRSSAWSTATTRSRTGSESNPWPWRTSRWCKRCRCRTLLK